MYHGEIFGATSVMVVRICLPTGLNRVKVFENLGATMAVPVAPVNTSLIYQRSFPAPGTIFRDHRNICSVHLLHRQFMLPFLCEQQKK